jgi:hypothetical protein
MKDIQSIVISICIAMLAVYFFFQNSNQNKSIDNLYQKSLNQCQYAIGIQDCSLETIKVIIANKSDVNSSQRIIWNTDDELIDLSTGFKLVLDLNNLNSYQKVVWESYLIQKAYSSKNDQNKFPYKDLSNYGLIFLISLFALFILFFVIKFLWKFILNRISEVSDATKGKKF